MKALKSHAIEIAVSEKWEETRLRFTAHYLSAYHISPHSTFSTPISPMCLTLYNFIKRMQESCYTTSPSLPFSASSKQNSMNKPKKILITVLLRFLALGATVSAAIIMVTSHEETNVFNTTFKAKYSQTPAFKYFMIAEAIASGYTLAAMFLSSKASFTRLSVIFDVVATMLLTSSISAALAIGQVGKKGNSHAGWMPICGQVPRFCKQVQGALISGFAAPVIYLLILLFSIHSLFSHPLATK